MTTRSSLLSCAFLLSVLALNAAMAVEVTVVKADGEEASGALQGISAQGGVTIAGKPIALRDIAEIRFQGVERVSAKGKTRAFLRNDDVVNVTVQAGSDTALKVESAVLGALEIKNDLLRGLAFPIKSPPSEIAIKAFFSGKDPDRDRMLTPKGETVQGFMESLTDKALVFDTDGQKRTIPYEQLAAFRYAALEAFKPTTGIVAQAQLNDGSILSGSLTSYTASTISLTNPMGMVWKIPDTAIQAISFKGGRLVYLSDLEVKAEQKPYVGGAPIVLRWRKDASVIGEPLNIGRRTYRRGLGVRSYCKLTFDLAGKFDRLLTDVGMDASAGAQSACEWKIMADGKQLAAEVAKAGAAAKRLKLPVTNVRSLELICDFGPDQDDAGDHFNWAGARLLKK